MTEFRLESDSLGQIEVAADKLSGTQTQRSLDHFSIGKDPILNRSHVFVFLLVVSRNRDGSVRQHGGRSKGAMDVKVCGASAAPFSTFSK